jgi:hypothetical protein
LLPYMGNAIFYRLPSSPAALGCMTVAHERELCYTCVNKDICSSQERKCVQALISSP